MWRPIKRHAEFAAARFQQHLPQYIFKSRETFERQCDSNLVLDPTPVAAPPRSVPVGDRAGTLDVVEGAGVLLDGVALCWSRRVRPNGALWLEDLQEAPRRDGGEPPPVGMRGMKNPERERK